MYASVYMRDSRLSVMLVCPSGTDPLVSGLCRAFWSSWLLTRLSTARYRYWYCSCRGQTRLQDLDHGAGWKQLYNKNCQLTNVVCLGVCTYYIIKYPWPHEVGHPCHLIDVYGSFLL